MDTIVIKLKQTGKAKMLIEMLQSLDFVSTVAYFDRYVKAKKLLEEINQLAAQSPLPQLSLDDINEEIKNYRSGK